MKNPLNDFDRLPFPVFAADKNGAISYKNRAAIRYIGTLRRGSKVTNYLLDKRLPKSGDIAYLSVPTPYPNAMILAEENKLFFLCFSRLQYPDAALVSKRLLTRSGHTPAALLQVLRASPANSPERRSFPKRLYTDLVRRIPLKKPFAHTSANMVKELFEQTSPAFCALGFRLTLEISPDFFGAYPIDVDRFDLMYLLELLLYLVMKLSADGRIFVALESDESENAHFLRFKTRAVSPCKRGTLPVSELMEETIPECIPELLLVEGSDLIGALATLGIDEKDELRLQCRLPYLPAPLSLQSHGIPPLQASFFQRLCGRIAGRLKGIPSSYRYFSAGRSKRPPQAPNDPSGRPPFPQT